MLRVDSPTVGDEAKDSKFSGMKRPFQSAFGGRRVDVKCAVIGAYDCNGTVRQWDSRDEVVTERCL